MIDQSRATGPVVIVDGGESLMKSTRSKRGATSPGQGRREAKAKLIMEEWVASGIDAAALGRTDWSLGPEFVRELVVESGYPVLAANLVCEGGERPYPAAKIVHRAGHTIGIVGLTEGVIPGCVVTEPEAAARAAIELLAPYKVEVSVLLWPTRTESAHNAGIEGLPYEFLVDASGRYGKKDSPTRAGQSWLLGAGSQTKAVGKLDLLFEGGDGFFPIGFNDTIATEEARLRSRIDLLDTQLAKDPEREKPLLRQKRSVQARLSALAQQRQAFGDGNVNPLHYSILKLDDTVADHGPTLAKVEKVKQGFGTAAGASPSEIIARPLVAPTNSPYTGAKTCISCHKEQAAQWRTTPHARAMLSLIRKKNHNDDACIGCHVTGGDPGKSVYPVIVTSPESIGGMINVQCEACHGPGRAHATNPTTLPVRHPSKQVCTQCHDGARDDGQFDHSVYLPKVAH